MCRASSASFFFAYALLSLCTASAVQLVSFDLLPAVPTGWRLLEDHKQQSQALDLTVHLRPANFHRLEQTVLSGANPDHQRYGQHLKRDEVMQMMLPTNGVRTRVIEWLHEAGIHEVRVEDIQIKFSAPIDVVNQLLDAEFRLFEDGSDRTVIRTLNYSLPADLEADIEMIQPTTRFPRIHNGQKSLLDRRAVIVRQPAINTSDCRQFVNPRCLRQLYNITDVHVSPKVNNTLAVNSFDFDYAQYDDLAQFQREYAPWTEGHNFTWTSINGGKETQNGAGSEEANLDVQYAMAIGYPAQIHVYSTGGHGPTIPDLNIPADSNEPWLDLLNYVVRLPDDKLPQTMSTSYGEDEQSLPRGYAQSVCNKFACLAARGVSVIVGSGDWGPGIGCQSNDGKNTTQFIPIFPSVCPWVTSVGGTQYSSKGFPHEEAASFSSGGFSNYFKRPVWQDAAVKGYLDGLDGEWHGLYNKSGRGFPDVAAQANGFVVIGDGEEDADMGTSAASPVFAGVVALLNGARLNAGLSPLGFLNPWLYGKAHGAFHDITQGKSSGCNQYLPPFIPHAGWHATKGWDAVTGFGTPNFGELLHLALEH